MDHWIRNWSIEIFESGWTIEYADKNWGEIEILPQYSILIFLEEMLGLSLVTRYKKNMITNTKYELTKSFNYFE